MELSIKWHEKDWLIQDLQDYKHNPRTMSKVDFERLVTSIKEDGYHQRLLINADGTIIGGHSRKKALLKAGYKNKDKIKVLVPDRQLTPEELDRINIKDNLPFGDWDFEILGNRFDKEQLFEWGMPESLLEGFSSFTQAPSFTDEELDDVLPPPTDSISKPGDLWQLGDHILKCGDSTNADDVASLMGKIVPNLMVTDPPYGVNYDASWREGADLGIGKRSKGKVLNDDRADWLDTYILFPGNVMYIWHGGLHTHEVAKNIVDCGFGLVTQIIWVKQHFVLSRGDYHWQHEPCWYAVRRGCKHAYNGARDQATTWNIKNNNSFGNGDKEETVGHSTQKPIECMLRPIMNNSKEGDYVYDPFGGSGTTLIACEKSKRKCLMMELSPIYCDTIIARWERLTEQNAKLLNGIEDTM